MAASPRDQRQCNDMADKSANVSGRGSAELAYPHQPNRACECVISEISLPGHPVWTSIHSSKDDAIIFKS